MVNALGLALFIKMFIRKNIVVDVEAAQEVPAPVGVAAHALPGPDEEDEGVEDPSSPLPSSPLPLEDEVSQLN